MKVLFVCRANVIRSQMAAALYNHFSNSTDADSAGIIVGTPGQTLGERAKDRPAARFVIEVMQQKGLDLTDNKRTPLTKEMLGHYDLVINMAAQQYVPQWLAEASNYVYWPVADPMGKGLAATAEARDTIEQKVKALLDQT